MSEVGSGLGDVGASRYPAIHGLGEGPKNLPAQRPTPRSQVAVHQLLENLRVGYERLRLLGRHAAESGRHRLAYFGRSLLALGVDWELLSVNDRPNSFFHRTLPLKLAGRECRGTNRRSSTFDPIRYAQSLSNCGVRASDILVAHRTRKPAHDVWRSPLAFILGQLLTIAAG